MKVQPIDAAWRAHHPLPSLGEGQDKDARGTALIVGGSMFVPGAVSLVGEATLRAGAGKAKLATIERAAIGIGVAFPEAAIIALPIDDEGEIDATAHATLEHHVERCDALILGPGMLERPQTASLVEGLLGSAGSASSALLDAGALTAMRGKQELLRERDKPVVLTPHHGELAGLTGAAEAAIAHDPAKAAHDAAAAFGAIVALKASETLIADGHGGVLRYVSDVPGLGTAGSGDVLAGIIGGLLARGVDPLIAAAWGVWIHGEAGKLASAQVGPTGFLARDLVPHVPCLVSSR